MVFKSSHLTHAGGRCTSLALCISVILCMWSMLASAIEAGQFYRYVNDDGVKVISSTIPPSYAQKGYEVINRSGTVLRVVEAAPDPAEVEAEKARRAEQRALLSQYKVLARRYSNVKEIYAARDRRLTHINANIAILNSNINNLSHQIEELMSKAAGYERSGKKVPVVLLNNLEETRAQKKSTEVLLADRKAEHDGIFAEFQKSADLYLQGKQLDLQVKDGELDLAEPGPPKPLPGR